MTAGAYPSPIGCGEAFKVVGLGGVGGIVARYLALFLRALGRDLRLVLVDGDSFEQKNATRMAWLVPGNKAEVVADELGLLLEDSRVALSAVPEFLTPENLPDLLGEGDTILLAVDNHATRKLVTDHVAGLKDAVLISGGNDGVGEDSHGRMRKGTFGNVQVFVRADGRDVTPPLDAFHPEIRDPADRRPDQEDCLEAMLSTPQLLFANLQTASSMLASLWVLTDEGPAYGEVSFDIAAARMAPSPLGMPTGEPGPGHPSPDRPGSIVR
jgi:hypothetical protein